MCDFGISEGAAAAISISTAVTSAISAITSITTSIITSIQQSNAAKAQAKMQQNEQNYKAKIDKKNANIAQQNADQKRQEGIEEARKQRMEAIRKVGGQQAAMAANGIDISEGTALDVIEDTAAMGELDALTTRYNYESQALAYEAQADNYNNQATLDELAGKNAYTAGKINAQSAMIKGLGDSISVAAKWGASNAGSFSKGGGKMPSTNGMKISGGFGGDSAIA